MSGERLYHVIAINERTGRKVYLTVAPENHHHACTILRKCERDRSPHKIRVQLEEVL